MVAQTVKGKLVDQNGIGLDRLQLKLYSSPNISSATSTRYGYFTFDNISDVKEDQLPTGYAVSNNFPNPFNPKTRIYITLPNSGNVRIEVFNILGQKVRDEVERYFSAGTNFIDFELNGLPNGMYLANLTLDGKYSVTKKLMLLYGSQHLNSGGGTPSFQLEATTSSISSIMDTKIDSLVVTSPSITRKVFTGFSNVVGSSLDIGNLVVDIPTTGSSCPSTPTVEYAGKTYNTVQIGTQCWLKENLDIGTMIQGNEDATNNGVIEKYCYANNANNCNTYGGLYQWAETVQYKNGATNTTSPSAAFSGNVQGICPTGWHIPTLAEFETLAEAVNNDGNGLKAIGQGCGYGPGTNTSGFSALLAGYRYYYNSFFTNLRDYTYFWSSTENYSDNAYYMYLIGSNSGINMDYNFNNKGFSVRCVKD